MATVPYFEPFAAGNPTNSAMAQVPYVPAQNAAWRRGDFLTLQTTGTVTTPSGGLGALIAAPGPTFGTPVNVQSTAAQTNTAATVTVTGVAQATAPAQSYYVNLTYTATGAESLTGTEFIVNCSPGYVFSVNVLAPTAPTGATNYAVYASVFPSYEILQQATKTTTALGTAFALTFPLVNNYGVSRAATSSNTNIVGLAINSSLADYYSGPGGSFLVNENSLFGATQSQNPLVPNESFLGFVIKPQNAQLFEISLLQQYNPSLIGATAGLTLTTSGFFVADTSLTTAQKILTIYSSVDGVASVVGNGQETSGKRVIVYFNGGIV